MTTVPEMLKFVEERWEEVEGEEDGVRRVMAEQFGFLYASQVPRLPHSRVQSAD